MRALVFLALYVLASVSGCDDADAHRAPLAGTWQREFDFDGGRGRTTLVLETKGKFTEHVRVTNSLGVVDSVDYEGLWLTDGSSFTLRYLKENGRQYGGGMVRFTTLQLTSVESDEFVGRNELRAQTFVYRRAKGT